MNADATETHRPTSQDAKDPALLPPTGTHLANYESRHEVNRTMKILLYGLNYTPEPTGIGKYSGEMAKWLSDATHEVRVIAAPPYYPSWAIGSGYSAWGGRRESIGGVPVWRTAIWVPSTPSGLKRVVHLASFAAFSIPTLVRQMFWRPDVIIVVAPAFACAPGGWLAARICGAKAWLHIQDFEVDAAFRMGMLRNRVAQKALGLFERWMVRRFDRVSTISQRMMEVLTAKKVDPAKTVLFPNWVDIGDIVPATKPSSYRSQLRIANDAIVALYSGSMAGKQGLELLPAAARALRERLPNLVIVICGDGVAKAGLERECRGLSNVRMLELQCSTRLGDLLGLADVHLLPQHAEAADLVMPSKLTGMLSSGRPVLATAHEGTELANVVAGVGLVVPPGDLDAFTAALIVLAESATLRAELGAAARRYAEDRLARGRVLFDFEQALKQCVGKLPVPKIESNTASSSAGSAAGLKLTQNTPP